MRVVSAFVGAVCGIGQLLAVGNAKAHSVSVAISECRIGSDCTVGGKLLVSEGFAGVIEDESGCMLLALPENILHQQAKWDGRYAIVRGHVYEQPSRDPGYAAVWYTLRDRRVAAGWCTSGPFMYVDSILKAKNRRQ